MKKSRLLVIVLLLIVIFTSIGYCEIFELKWRSHIEGSLGRKAAETFIELVNEKCEHELKPIFNLPGEIAKSDEVVDALNSGMIDISVGSPSWASNYDARMNLFNLPYLWKSDSHFLNYIIEMGGGEKLGNILLEKAGVRPIVWYPIGFRWMFFKDRINKIEDLENVKMRSPGSQVFLDMMDILGINAITVPYSEIFTSLNTGLVEAVEMPPSLAHEQRYHEVVNYSWPSLHMMGVQFIAISDKLWQTFPIELRQAMEEAAYETTYYMYGISKLFTNKAVKKMGEETGLEVIYDVDPSPLTDMFKEYQAKWAEEHNVVEILEEIWESK